MSCTPVTNATVLLPCHNSWLPILSMLQPASLLPQECH
jgi:hypothetical protein